MGTKSKGSIVVSDILPVSVAETNKKAGGGENSKNMHSLIKMKEKVAQNLQASEEWQDGSSIFKWGGGVGKLCTLCCTHVPFLF